MLWQGRGAILSITIEKTEVVKSVVNHLKAEKLHSVAINCMRLMSKVKRENVVFRFYISEFD